MEAATLRERKRLRTRATIESQALALFARGGYDAVTVAQIAAASDVAPRTFFRYFATKEDVLYGRDDEILAGLGALVDSRPAGEPAAATVRAVCVAMGAWAQANHDVLAARAAVIAATPGLRGREAAKRAAIEDLIAERLAGRGEDVLSARLHAKLTLACFDTAVAAWLRDGGDLDAVLAATLAALPGH
jgi:AcrR family transcriptional regulator